MAVRAQSTNPQQLLNKIKTGVRSGTILTWALDTDGDFTHATQQWKFKAWFRPMLGQGVLVFNILGPVGKVVSTETYAIYHGRFIEMLLAHFDGEFSRVSATALPEPDDIIR